MEKQQVLFLGYTFLVGFSLFSMEENKSPNVLRRSTANLRVSSEIKAIINKVESENKQVSQENSPSQCFGWEGRFANSGNLLREYDLNKRYNTPDRWAPWIPDHE